MDANLKSINIITNTCKKFKINGGNLTCNMSSMNNYIDDKLVFSNHGETIFKNVGGLKNKESDRVKEMQKVLKQVGIRTLLSKNELRIFGKGMINGKNKKIIIPNLGDHRIAMSAFVLASLTGAKAKIKNFETVFTSSPSFLKIMKILGAKFEKQK